MGLFSIDLLGIPAGGLATDVYLPQAMKVTAGNLGWLLYGLRLEGLPLILANALGLALTATILAMKLRRG